MSQFEPRDAGPTDSDVDNALASLTDMEEYAERLRSWAGDPVALYPRMDGKEARGGVVSFRLPETFERRLDHLVQLGRERGLPWPSRTDFLRDAAVWFSEVVATKIAEDDPFLQSLAEGKHMADRLDMMNGASKRAIVAAQGTYELIQKLLGAGRDAEAHKVAATFRAEIRGMREPYIRSQYELALDANQSLKDILAALETPAHESKE